MRQLLVTITFLSVVFITRAQTNLAGNYSVSGFLYHPSASRYAIVLDPIFFFFLIKKRNKKNQGSE